MCDGVDRDPRSPARLSRSGRIYPGLFVVSSGFAAVVAVILWRAGHDVTMLVTVIAAQLALIILIRLLDRPRYRDEPASSRPAIEAREEMERLRARWSRGERDRETALRLMFFCWYARVEPAESSGLSAPPDAVRLIAETFAALGGVDAADAEAAHVASLMAEIAAWGLGDEQEWRSLAAKLKERSRRLRPGGFSRADFAGKGHYGEYFGHLSEHGA